MKYLFITFSVFFSLNCLGSELVGLWKSNEELTLRSMNEVGGVSAKARRVFENGFFGRLNAEYREKDGRVYFDNAEDNTEENYKHHPYTLIEETDEYFLIKYFDLLEETSIEMKMYREDNCYFMHVSQWKFREYFCKVL